MLSKICNGIVGYVLATVATMEMLAPRDGASGVYYGIPPELLQGTEPSASFARHCISTIGALHFGLAACLILSTSGTYEVQRNAAVGTTCAMIMHAAACFRTRPFDGHVSDPVSMPIAGLILCIACLMLGVVVDADTTELERATAIKTAEQKEFKGDMMENREYVKQLEEARKGTTGTKSD